MRVSSYCADFSFCLLFYFIGGVVSQKLSPNKPSVEKYANLTHVQSCLGKGVKWYHKNQPIPNNGRVHVEEIINEALPGSRLFFERLEIGDEGEYICKAGGEKVSFSLKVIQSISFGSTPRVQRTNEFQNFTLKCEVSGVPKPKVSWYFKEKPVEDGTKYRVTPTELEIRNVTMNDVGEYQCKAYQLSFENSDRQEINITLKVNHKPIWINKPNNSDRDMFYGYLMGMVNLTCAVLAEPEATFVWRRKHKPLKASNYNGTIISEPNRSILQLPILNSSYYGEYECQAQNVFGKIERYIMLEKGEKPDMPSVIEVRRVSVHEADIKALSSAKHDDIIGFRMQYAITSPGIEVDWSYSHYQDFNKTEGGIYTITDLLEYTGYVVKVASRNVAGLSDFSAEYSFRTHKEDSTSGAAVNMASLILIFTPFVIVH